MNREMSVHHAADSSAFEEIAAVYNAGNGLDNPDHTDLDGDYFKQSYSIPDVDITRDVMLVRNKIGRAVAFGAILPVMGRAYPSSLLTMYVHPAFRQAGIGSQLLGNLIAGAQDKGASKVTCNVPSFRPAAISFLEKRGFRPIREWAKLVHTDIGNIHGQTGSTKLTYRTIEDRDAGKWASLQNSLFKGSFNYREVTPEDYVRKTQADTFCRDLALFGLCEGHTIAYCIGTLLGPMGSQVGERRLVIDGIGVTPHFRRHGFGSSILNEILVRAASMGVKRSELIVDTVDFPASMMYKAAGYRERYKRIWYECKLT